MSTASTAAGRSRRAGRRGAAPAQSERRRRMLEATIELAGEGGFDAVQMREVAERADVALGTLYRYFPSKVHLLVAALDREFERTETRTATRPVAGDTPHERVMRVLGRMSRALQQQPRLAEALVRAFMFADASVSQEIRQVGRRLTTVIARAIAGSTEPSETSEDEAARIGIVADVWLAALVGWVSGRKSAAEVEESVDVAVRLLL